MKWVSLIFVVCVGISLAATEENSAEKSEQQGVFKRTVKKSAKEVKEGFVEFGRTIKKDGKKLKKHAKDSFNRDKAKVKQDFHRTEEPSKKSSE